MMNKKIISKYIWSPDPGTDNSSSAGAFFLIARAFLEKYQGKSAIYGSALGHDNTVRHIRVDTECNLTLLQGSKYVQSNTCGIFQDVLRDLKRGFFVLFSGTACQTAAAYKYAGSYSEKLFTVDVLCHGVPSPLLWEKYVKYLEIKYDGRIKEIKFRNKSSTNRLGYLLRFKVNNSTKIVYPNESSYYTAFLDGSSLRPCCYSCPFIGDYAYADMTIADSNEKSFHPYQAISLILTRTKKGKQLYELIDELIESTDADYLLEKNVNRKLTQPTKRPVDRDSFYINIEESLMDNESLVVLVKNRLKAAIPTTIKDTVRKIIKDDNNSNE